MFQSTHPYRVRLATSDLKNSSKLFQSTHPYRVRRCHAPFEILIIEFQSTHPYRVRLWRPEESFYSWLVSIHAPV